MHSEELVQRFRAAFGAEPKIFGAPGRVNLIGEHTDYNDGFVMPCAIGYRARVAISPRPDRKLLLRSEQFPERFEFEVDRLPARRLGAWCDYVLGVLVTLKQVDYPLQGANLMVQSEVPIGAGLSSSAALEVATAFAFMGLNGSWLPLPEIAKLCQRAENGFVGARVGIMDQFVSCMGKAGHALLLDCRSLASRFIPISDRVRLVICNTMVKHELAGGEYNRRRVQCEEGVKILSRSYAGIRALRDVSAEQLEQHRHQIPDPIYKRCAHVVHENQRTLEAAECLAAADLSRFGELMHQSHRSLRDLYEVSCPELDTMVEVAEGLPGYWGGRMTGGGFGGCTVNLVSASEAQVFAEQVAERYRQKTNIKPEVYVCSTAGGAGAELPDLRDSN